LNNYGVGLANLKSYENAISIFKKILKISPSHSYALYNLSIVYLKKGDFQNAKYYLRKYISFYDNQNLKTALVSIYLKTKDYVEAENILKSYLKTTSDANLQKIQGSLVLKKVVPQTKIPPLPLPKLSFKYINIRGEIHYLFPK
jgi:Tfp pilus assembly protein PilF